MTIKFQNCPTISKIGKTHPWPFGVSRNNISNEEDLQGIFSGLVQVYVVDISSNPMVGKLPNALYNLVNLEELRLFNLPKLKELPDITVEHTNVLADLAILDIRNTSIARIPSLYLRLNTLEYVYLEGSPLCYNGWL